MSRLPNVPPGLAGRPDLIYGLKEHAKDTEAARRAALLDRQAGYQAELQRQRMAGQAGLSQQDAVQQQALAQQAAANRSALMQQQAGHEQQAAEQHVDLQGRLQQIQLTQSEQMRMNRIRNGIADVDANPNFSPYEKNDLKLQMQTGLDPLQHRQSQANILHTQIQTQSAQQQMMQQAQLFHQHQSFLSSRLQDRVQMVTDPNTGATQAFFMDERGNPTPMDFSQNQDLHQMRMAHMGQQLGITAAMAPGQLEAQQLQNQGTRTANTFAAQANPERLAQLQQQTALGPVNAEHARAQLAALRQSTEQHAQLFPLQVQHSLSSLDRLDQELQQHGEMHPETLRLAQAHANQLEQQVNEGMSPQLLTHLYDHIQGQISREESNPNSALARELRNKPPEEQATIRQRHVQQRFNDARNTLRPQRAGGGGAAPAATPAALRQEIERQGGTSPSPTASPPLARGDTSPAALQAHQTVRQRAREQMISEYMRTPAMGVRGRTFTRQEAERIVDQSPRDLDALIQRYLTEGR